MAPMKKHPDNSGLSKNHQKKTKRRRPSNKLNLIYKYLGNLCDLKTEKPTKSTRRNTPRRKGRKPELYEDSKHTDSEKSFKDFDSPDPSDDEEFDDCISESSIDYSKNDSKGEMRMKSFIRKALDVGIQNGYLVPEGTSCRVLRVASDLVELENRKRKHKRSQSDDTFGDEVVDKKRRRSKGRKRRRRRSRGRGRRRMAKNEESEEMAGDDEDENIDEDLDDEEDQDNKKKQDEEEEGNVRKTRSNAPDRDIKETKKEENTDDEGSDEEQEKKG